MSKFGVELEFYLPANFRHMDLVNALRAAGINADFGGYMTRHYANNVWKVCEDGSLDRTRGAEIVSPILDTDDEASVNMLKTVCTVLTETGCGVDAALDVARYQQTWAWKCGMHVHHDAGDFTPRTLSNLMKCIYKFGDAIDSILPPSRRPSAAGSQRDGHRWCRKNLDHVAGGSIDAGFDIANEAAKAGTMREAIGTIPNHYDRYQGLNLSAYGKHGTLEFRQHQGTTEFQKIMSWVLVTARLMDMARKTKGVKKVGGTLETLIAKCDRQTKKYIRARAKKFAAA